MSVQSLHHHYIILILTIDQDLHWMMPGNHTKLHTMSLLVEMMVEGVAAHWEEDHVILSTVDNDKQLAFWEHLVTCEHSLMWM